jgi:HPt (histidine-containing phosphotransfer) domain-containing protein
MSESLFATSNGLDIDFLDEAYGDDAETAALMFQQYLDELPANMELLNDSINKNDIERFRHLIHKQKPVFSYVGLTDVTNSLQDLQLKCHTTEDLNNQKDLINNVLDRIRTSAEQIKNTLRHLQNI